MLGFGAFGLGTGSGVGSLVGSADFVGLAGLANVVDLAGFAAFDVSTVLAGLVGMAGVVVVRDSVGLGAEVDAGAGVGRAVVAPPGPGSREAGGPLETRGDGTTLGGRDGDPSDVGVTDGRGVLEGDVGVAGADGGSECQGGVTMPAP